MENSHANHVIDILNFIHTLLCFKDKMDVLKEILGSSKRD